MTIPGKISIYVDGSCEENRNVSSDTPAGWGFCVVIGDTGLGKGQGEIVTEKSGPVVTKKTSSEYIGSEVGSNNTAELCAIANALKRLTDRGKFLPICCPALSALFKFLVRLLTCLLAAAAPCTPTLTLTPLSCFCILFTTLPTLLGAFSCSCAVSTNLDICPFRLNYTLSITIRAYSFSFFCHSFFNKVHISREL